MSQKGGKDEDEPVVAEVDVEREEGQRQDDPEARDDAQTHVDRHVDALQASLLQGPVPGDVLPCNLYVKADEAPSGQVKG